MHSMSIEVSIKSVYCSHGDAPEGAVLEGEFFEDGRPKFAFLGPECINIRKTIVSNFGSAFLYLLVVSPKRPFWIWIGLESSYFVIYVNFAMLSEVLMYD